MGVEVRNHFFHLLSESALEKDPKLTGLRSAAGDPLPLAGVPVDKLLEMDDAYLENVTFLP